MITVFNRKALAAVFSMDEQAKIRSLLAENGIDYRVKTVNRMSASPFAAGTRSRIGTLCQDPDAMYEYVIYVKKQDHDRAKSLLQ